MQQVRSSLEIGAPVDTVFAFVDDWRNADAYLRFIRLEPVDGERTQGTGAVFTARIALASPAPVFWQGRLEVTDHYYPQRIVMRSGDGGALSVSWSFGRLGDRSLVELVTTFSLPGGLVGQLAGNALVPVTQRNLDGALKRLKEQVESGGP